MSIRNIDADLASNKLNELFHLHRYEDCVLYINRVSHLILKKVLNQLPISLYLSRLPYTIEIFEAIYAKMFILDPDNFPIRALQPERLIDKMVSYFSLLSDQAEMEPIDGAKMLDSFENVIRIISYVQPNLYSRLLYFKYAIDRACLKFEKDLALYNKNLSPFILNDSGSNSNIYATNTISRSTSKKQINNYTNALLISRASNMQTCEKIRVELVQTINNCHKALIRLNEYISNLKSQKVFKQVQLYLNESNTGTNTSLKSPKKHKRNSSSNERTKANAETSSIAKSRSESVCNLKTKNQENTESNSKDGEKKNFVNSSTICQDFIQNRLYLNKAMMNAVEPHLETVKLQQMLANLYEKIDLDKEILLVFTHLKREENYLNSLEPLQPLFKRYSLGFERCIQIWRKKCSADSLLLFNDNISEPNFIEDSSSFTKAVCTTTNNKKCSPQKQKYLATLSATTEAAAKIASDLEAQEILRSNISINCLNLQDEFLNDHLNDLDVRHQNQKYFSEVNLYTNTLPSGYNTMPTKLRPKKIITSETDTKLNQIENGDDYSDFKSIHDSGKKKAALTKNVETQTSLEFNDKDFSEKENTLNNQLIQLEQQLKASNKKFSEDVEKLNRELENANNTIAKLRKNENKLREKLKEKEDELNEKLSSSNSTLIATNNDNQVGKDPMTESIISTNYQYTSDLISIYNNLNHKYRIEAFESLDTVKDIQSMNEFKIKLLFSVVVLSYRYVKLYIRDLKRKIKTLLQINDRGSSTERSSSQKSKSMTPTIIVEDTNRNCESDIASNASTIEHGSDNTDQMFFGKNDSKNFKYNGRYNRSSERTKYQDSENCAQIIEQAINKYLQVVTMSNSYDLKRIIEDVKEQLWSTLYEYPLKDCQELNSYINEAVKTCWSLVNHQPPFKLEYSSTKYDSSLHERAELANSQNEQILYYIWPSLVDTSDNVCLSKGIVNT